MSFSSPNSNGTSSAASAAFGNPSHSSYKWWVRANIMIGTSMAVLDSTIVNVSLPKIMAAFGISVDKAEWVITGYLLAFAAMLPSSGWFADHFGYKRLYMIALFLFTAGSFLCAMAWNENVLIAFRVIQGSGGGIITPDGMAIVLREFPHERRGTALGFWAVAAAGSVSFGPLVGGYLADQYLGSKRAVKFGAILMALGYFTLCFGGDTAKPYATIGGQRYEVQVSNYSDRPTSSNTEVRYLVDQADLLHSRFALSPSFELENLLRWFDGSDRHGPRTPGPPARRAQRRPAQPATAGPAPRARSSPHRRRCASARRRPSPANRCRRWRSPGSSAPP